MLVLEESVQFELTVKNSRFLAEAFVVANAEAAREKLRNQKERFSDASHVVHAFIVGPEGNVMGSLHCLEFNPQPHEGRKFK